ncbi:unnamed protein product [Caenorhabditis nigoni]
MLDCDSVPHVCIETEDTSKDDKPIIVIAAGEFSELDKSISIPREGDRYVAKFDTEYPVINFKDRVVAVKWTVDYVTDLFNLDVYELVIDTNGFWAIDWINNRQEKMLVRFAWYGDEALDYVLRNARASEYYTLSGNVSDNYRFDGILGPANHLSISSNGHWATLDNLMNFDFASIFVKRCRLSVPDFYAFIGHWRSGGSPRLTFLSLVFENQLDFEQLDFEHFEDELEVVERDLVGEFRLTSDGENIQFDEGYSIQRSDDERVFYERDSRQFHPLVYWPMTKPLLPKLLRIARKIFGVPATEADVERTFSILKNVYASNRMSMDVRLLENIMIIKETPSD